MFPRKKVIVSGDSCSFHSEVALEIPVCARNNEVQDQLFAAVRELGRQMDIGIEMVPFLPARMFPLPRHWKRRARFIECYGSIDGFYFDFATLALMKMYRWTTRDIKDVKRLLERGEITFQGLDRAFKRCSTRLARMSMAGLILNTSFSAVLQYGDSSMRLLKSASEPDTGDHRRPERLREKTW